MPDAQYYLIKDLNLVGKIEGRVPYVYDPSDGWKPDQDAVLMDRVIGYDGELIGCTSMLTKVDEITEAQAQEYIKSLH